MTGKITLEEIVFDGLIEDSSIKFYPGVNVICGASDTGKSFLAEAIDFMMGGSTLKEIPERLPYSSAALKFEVASQKNWKLKRALSGGNFQLFPIVNDQDGIPSTLKQKHAHGKTDNVSGFLLENIGLLNRRILKSKTKGTTQSLSFRDLARLIIIQEGEIQSPQSPFLTGQFTTPTAEMATLKLLLTGVDDSSVVPPADESPDNARQIALIEEIISDLSSDITDMGFEKSELTEQLETLQAAIEDHRNEMQLVQGELSEKLANRKTLLDECIKFNSRNSEIDDLLARFDLLQTHYAVDKERLTAIQESGTLFVHAAKADCPLCGASPDSQHMGTDCDGDVEGIVAAATAEINKIDRLLLELKQTVADLRSESVQLVQDLSNKRELYNAADELIRASISPMVVEARTQFSEIIEKKAEVQSAIDMFDRLAKLQERRQALIGDDGEENDSGSQPIEAGVPDAAAHALSMRIERILRAWNFPGDCRVHFDKERKDFVIDGKPRGSRGKGLRAITHAAITIALMEYCREQSLPHPGFVVMDSPLLAYFEPEGEDEEALQGTDLKERFYEYLIQQHGRDSQVIIIENQHPPAKFDDKISLTVFTRNPTEGRFGLL